MMILKTCRWTDRNEQSLRILVWMRMNIWQKIEDDLEMIEDI